MDKQQEFVLRTLEERDIRFVRLWFTDVLGYLKSVAVAPAELEQAFDEGIGFDGSAIEGFARVYESDMIAKPDPGTFQILPWRAEAPGTARMFCDILMPDGSPSFADPRYVLKRILAKTSDLGFTFYTHPEIEFFLLKNKPVDGSRPTPADSSGYFDHTPQNVGMDFRRQAITMLESMGISVEFSHHEGAPGQQEIDLRYADALSTADNIMTFRLVMKQVALEQGVQATFMPKPFSEFPGSGMHTHLSLFEGDRNAFYESGAEYQLSKVGRSFIAGLLKHAAEISAVTNQWVNSYKRIWGGSARAAGAGGEALVHLLGPQQPLRPDPRPDVQARQDRFGPRRGPLHRLRRQPLPDLRGTARRGPQGHRGGYELPAGADDDVWALSDAERRAMGIEPLPQNLGEAISLMEKSELVAETLGEHVFDFFLRNKKQEWEEYRSEVTAFELKALLPVL